MQKKSRTFPIYFCVTSQTYMKTKRSIQSLDIQENKYCTYFEKRYVLLSFVIIIKYVLVQRQQYAAMLKIGSLF